MDAVTPQIRANSPWARDPSLDITLKTLFSKGLSFGQIAGVLGMTRNAVIGRISRLHFAKRTPSSNKTPKKPKIRSAGGLVRVRAWTPAVAVLPTPSTVGAFLGVALVDLIASDCRYPQGEGSHIRFCGQPALKNSPYCVAHTKLCYVRSNH